MSPHDHSRRDVLRGLGGFALLPAALRIPADCTSSAIPAVPNRAKAFSGIQAYAQKSVAAGDTIDFRVSSANPYQLSIVRLGWEAANSTRDWTLASFARPAGTQAIRPGSYVHVESALPPTAAIEALTLECWVRTFRIDRRQGLIGQYSTSEADGYGLFLTNAGKPAFSFGSGEHSAANALVPLRWYHLAVVFSAGKAHLYQDGVEVLVVNSGLPSFVHPGVAPLRLGALGDAEGTNHFLEGDLAMPCLYLRALNAVEIALRAQVSSPPSNPPVPVPAVPTVPTDPDVVGCWPLDEEQGTFVHDASTCLRHGVIVNLGTWMIGGPSFDAAAVDRFAAYDPDTDPLRGHGLRLSSSDLYDCTWQVSQSYTLPSDCPPGLYVGRIVDASQAKYDVTFVVRRSPLRPPARILVLCATSTWLAYNRPFGLFGFYDDHESGQPTYLQGLEMPWASADPYLTYNVSKFGAGYAHLVRAERHMHSWLEQNGYDYDVFPDHELHLDPQVLASYAAVLIVGHSEYWTRGGFDAVQAYLATGGRVLMASGNTMFWRVSLLDSVIECRKLPESVGGRPNAEWGELYHQHDHQRGGLLRECGVAEWQALALECVGYGNMGSYKVTQDGHPYFTTPEVTGAQNDQAIGGANAVGHEWDVTLAKIPGSVTPVPPSSYTPVVLAQGRSNPLTLLNPNIRTLDYHCNPIVTTDTSVVISEITDWSRTDGGRVLSIGSIAAARSLHNDGKMAAFFRNALHHNGVVFRLELTTVGDDGHLYTKSFDGSSWSTSWADAGPGFGDHPPTGIQWSPVGLAEMAISSAGNFLYRYQQNGAAWSAWVDFGASFRGRPAAVAWGRNRLDLFARGTNGSLYVKSWNGRAWSAWLDLAVDAATSAAAVGHQGRRITVATLDTAGNVLAREFADGSWAPTWEYLGGGPFAFAPSLVASGGKNLTLLAVATSGEAFERTFDGSTWSAWASAGGTLASRIHAASTGKESFQIFARGLDGRIHTRYRTGTTWSAWSDLGPETFLGEPVVAALRGGSFNVCATSTGGHLLQNLWNGTSWSGWQDLGSGFRPSPGTFRWIGG